MGIFKTRYFSGWAQYEGIADKYLINAIRELEQGLHDGNLGGGVYKKRIGVRGRGKRGSARTIVAFKFSEHAYFMYGYAKKAKSTLSPKEELIYKALAKNYFAMSDQEIKLLESRGELIEVCDDDEKN